LTPELALAWEQRQRVFAPAQKGNKQKGQEPLSKTIDGIAAAIHSWLTSFRKEPVRGIANGTRPWARRFLIQGIFAKHGVIQLLR
jgi:hypothetical protein